MSSGLELMQLALRHRRSTMPTTVAAIDELLGGGLPRGSLVELSARRSAGRFSIVLSTLAAATSAGEAAALIDLGDHLDPQELDDAGAELSRVLWIRPKTTKEAVMSAELLVTTGFPLVVVDLGLRPRGAKVADASWIRLARLAETHATALLVSSPWPLCGTAAAVSLSIPDRRVSWHGTGGAPRLITAIAARITLLRSKGQHLDVREGRTAAMVIRNVESIAIREEKTAGATDSRRGGVGSANAIPRHASHPEDAPAIVRHTPDAGDIPVFVRPAPHAGDAPVTVRHAPDAGDAPAIVRHASHAGGVPEGSRG
ncbi:MAG: hypothetical protein NDJ92_17355, partial [Thermoanaerobaculia bacterium]|nr:hypothetical protein [Thermoanaerobaculia bacterium]